MPDTLKPFGRTDLSGLVAITPDDILLPRLLALVKAALAGGVKLLQYRNKIAPPDLRRTQAKALLAVCRVAGARLIINDDVWLAVEIGADGAHIGRADAPGHSLKAARDALGHRRILGVSCYASQDEARDAVAAGADYISFGAVQPSRSRPKVDTVPLSLLTDVRKRIHVPIAAMGGITTANAREVVTAGADMLAVTSGLFDAMDIRQRARDYQTAFSTA